MKNLLLLGISLPLLLGGCGYKPNLKYENLKYKITSDSVTITGCDNNASGELVIPDTIKGKPVTTIGEMAFFRTRFLSIPRSLTSITLPDSVTSIGSSAFRGCKNLTSITIPNSVTSIGDGAFNGCTNLTAVTFLGAAPKAGRRVFSRATPTIYRKPEAKGWGDTWDETVGDGTRDIPPVKLISEKP